MRTIDPIYEDRTGAPAPAIVKPAPAENTIGTINSLTKSLLKLNKKERSLNLLKGVYYMTMHRLYEQYKQECYAAGMRYREVQSYESYRAGYGFEIDSQGWISELRTVALRYIERYGLANIEIQHRHLQPDLDWDDSNDEPELIRIELHDIHPLLLTVSSQRLYKCREYHNSKGRALDILQKAHDLKSRVEFFEWLATQPKPDQDLEREEADIEAQKDQPTPQRFKTTLRKVVHNWEIGAGLDWNDLFNDIEFPSSVRGLQVVIEISEISY